MYETEALWRQKRSGPSSGPGFGSLLVWLLRIGSIFGVGAVVLIIFVNFQGSLDPISIGPAELNPSREAAEENVASSGLERQLILRRAADGHFKVRAYINGVAIPFLVDTGASDVALSADAAERIGINLRNLKYTRGYQTANGVIYAAPVTLRDVRIGDLRVYDVEASVTKSNIGMSLLGMSFLNRLSSFEVRGRELILRW